MNNDYGFWDQLEGQWKQFRGSVRETWGKLTDDDFERAKGNRDQLVGRATLGTSRTSNVSTVEDE